MNMQKVAGTALSSTALAIAVLLTGCGSGGGGDEPAASTAERNVGGTAAKGLIKGGKVEVYAIDADGTRGANPIATTTTGSDGMYTVKIPASVLNFIVEVSAAAGATMADEATGTDIPVPASMKLRSVVALASGAESTYTGTVSPLTELIVKTAEKASSGKFTTQSVAEAKSGIVTLLGFDPEKVKPIDPRSSNAASASEEEKIQSLSLAAISKMAKDSKLGCGQNDPSERIACVVSQIANSATMGGGGISLNTSHREQLREAIENVVADSAINKTGKNSLVGAPVFSEDKVSTTPGTLTGIQATKKLFSSLRTNIQSVTEGDALKSTADRIQGDIETFIAPLGSDIVSMTSFSADAIEYLNDYQGNQSLPVNFTTSHTNGPANCTVLTTSSVECTFTRKYLPFGYITNGYTYGKVTSKIVLTQQSGGTTYNYSVKSVRHDNNYFYGSSGTTPTSTPIGTEATGTITYAKTGDTVSNVAIVGRMPGRLNSIGQPIAGNEQWNPNALRTDEGNNVYKYTVAGTFTSFKAGQPAGTIKVNDGSFARVALDAEGNLLQSSVNEIKLSMTGLAGETSINGSLHVSNPKKDKNGENYIPTSVSFNGSLVNQGNEVFTGKVALQRTNYEKFDSVAPESETNFPRDAVGLSGKLAVPSRPVLGISVNVTRDSVDGGSVVAQYSDGTSVINASVSGKKGDRHPIVTITSADGVRFEFTSTSQTVAVMKDNAKVAQLDLSKGMIHYNDNSFESIK